MKQITKFLSILPLVLAAGCGKPSVSETCTMNGFGAGSCSFTNVGDAEGSRCGKIRVIHVDDDKGDVSSSVFCSGEVKPSSTNEVEFSAPSVRELCKTESRELSWNDVCSFVFEAEASK